MFSLRPAYPRGIYVFGAVATVLLLAMSVLQPESGAPRYEAKPGTASSPQLLAMNLAQ
jgi:hypothetical protein